MTFRQIIFAFVLLFSGSIFAGGPEDSNAGVPKPQQDEDGHIADSAVTTLIDEVRKKMTEVSSTAGPVPQLSEQIEKLYPEMDKYASQWKFCSGALKLAADACLAERSGALETFDTVGQALMAIGSQAMNDSCSKTSDLLDKGKTGLTTYTGACEAEKKTCDISCKKANDNIDSFQKSVEAVKNEVGKIQCPPAPNDTICVNAKKDLVQKLTLLKESLDKEKKEDNKDSLAKKKKICEIDFQKMLMAAGASLGSLMQSMGQSKNCDKKTNVEKKSDAPAVNPFAELDCTKTENAQDPKCLCKANPRLTGCPGILASTGNSSSLNSSSFGATNVGATGSLGPSLADGLGAGGAGAQKPGGGVDGSAGGAMAGAPMGSLSGASSAGGASGGKGGEAAMKGGRSISTDIVAGEWGGSGGNRNFRSSPEELQKAYKDYQKSQAEKMSGQGALSQQLSSAGGKSNFEKVKNNYNTNQRSLRP